jgi:hypothetical protein
MRKVILHYHLFKNAGTSLDAAFKTYFAHTKWATKEFPGNQDLNKKQLTQWIESRPEVNCFSSHTAFLPVPKPKDTIVLPVIYMRHPIDRIVSAYSFEKKQISDSFGAVLARNTTLSGYIETRLSMPHDRQCSNFQSNRLAMMYPANEGTELSRAKAALESLPFCGIVEKYSESLNRLTKWLDNEGFTAIDLIHSSQNVSQNSSLSIDEKLNKLRQDIGQELYQRLLEVNADDLACYEHACQIWK